MSYSNEKRFNELSPLKKAIYKIEKYKSELANLKSEKRNESIAVIGMALEFPNAKNPEQYWDNIINKKDSIASFPKARKEQLVSYYKSKGIAIDTLTFQNGGYLNSIDHFDADFFKIDHATASVINPIHRLFLQTSWRAMEDAGYVQTHVEKTGIFLGASGDINYAEYIDIINQSSDTLGSASLTGNTNSLASSRLSYFMDFKGPALTIDTACSSSLVAIHLACNSLSNRDSDMAVAGGGKMYLLPEKGKYHIGFESPTGTTKPFDHKSDGAGIGEGVAAIVLKRLDDAIADKDTIYAVIKGTAINQDGKSSGIIAPNPEAQTSVIKEAATKAKIDLHTLGFIETHGTGTKLGDQIEFQALCDAFEGVSKKQFCALGAVKSNIGHQFEAAGIAGLIKCIMSLKHKTIAPSINHNKPNPSLDFQNSPFYFNTESKDWLSESKRRCAVSSFGISGTNAHVILEEYVPNKVDDTINDEKSFLFTLSAHNKSTLKQCISDYIHLISDENNLIAVADICYATNTKKGTYNWRFGVEVTTLAQLKILLQNPENHITQVEYSYKINTALFETRKEENGTQFLTYLLAEYKKGAVIPWRRYYQNNVYTNIDLPRYPLAETSCWPNFEGVNFPIQHTEQQTLPVTKIPELKYETIYKQLSELISVNTGIQVTEDALDKDLFDLGIDSIIIFQFIQTIKKQYNINLELGQFYNEVSNLKKLAEFIVKNGMAKSMTSQQVKKQVQYKRNAIDYFVPYKEIEKDVSKVFTTTQANHLEKLIHEIVTQTNDTKQHTQKYRKVLANNRNVAGFKPETKEITYQIIADKAKGSKIIDLDNNEYVDLTMGFGVNLLGYNPDFIEKALQEALYKGYAVGPMNATAGKVAALISELTGNERVAFYNSGSEAVMVALRLARATTRRKKYVIFKESYHGTFDGILAINNPLDLGNPIPLASGITENFIENTVVLEYGRQESLDYIEEHISTLAAVLVEPVQSRRPDIQPKEFLQELQKITKSNGTALIFDEVISGFRIHVGGAKKWFEIDPDICIYGKIVGGGMPIGVVAGNAEFMDAIDGGSWQFGDNSYPNKPTTFVAGTFNQHPLTMSASLALLTYLKDQGNTLQSNLNKKTMTLVKRLNSYFDEVGASVKVVAFGSLFRFFLKGGWDLFYQHLLANKIYVWEGRNCFLSTAHSDEDIEFIYQAVVKSTQAVLQSDWIDTSPKENTTTTSIAFSEDQEKLYALVSVNQHASSSFNENQIIELKGNLHVEAFQNAFIKVVNRHEVLRSTKIDENGYHIASKVTPKITYLQNNHVTTEAISTEDYIEFLGKQGVEAFNLANGPFIRMVILEISKTHHKILLTTHHLVGDGYSIEIIWNELSSIYATEIKGAEVGLLKPTGLSEFNQWYTEVNTREHQQESSEFWKKQFQKKYPKVSLATGHIVTPNSKRGNLFSQKIDNSLKERLLHFSKTNKLTVFNVLFATYTLLLQRLSSQTTFVVGIPSSGQLAMGKKNIVGQCVKMLPIYIDIDEQQTVTGYFEKIKTVTTEAIKHQNCSFNEILENCSDVMPPQITAEIDMNSVKKQLNFEGLEATFYFPPVSYVKYELSISIIEMDNNLMMDFYYNTALFDKEVIANWANCFLHMLDDAISSATKTISQLSIENKKDTNVFSSWNNL
ncbi:aminotransferase class III-fold pyridoxal phosphate-dependent enzyme [Kordia zhangzhouensis]|uniref:aminotransferase class III-fold pyridoxal phosphate-dependent enzyme n=1 Tax=Kordia zhangzhouensis TaxID=1620405 RepID=UPI0006297B87|nr:aminotransferase class III-fold pyridoxal phosphate-dependent enzyme [Kordia zhangzhouensis]